MNLKHIRKKSIGILVILLVLLSFIFIPISKFSGLGLRNGKSNPETATNYLFKDINYNITLNDVYDDEDLDKEFTDAYFQSQYFNSSYEWEQIHNESADSGVNNNEVQYGSPSGDYEATYSFENDVVGSIPVGWSKSGTGTAEVQTTKEDHNKILYMKGINGVYVNIYHYFDQSYSFGTVELWQYPVPDDIDWDCNVYLSETSSGYTTARLIINSAGTYVWYSGTATTTIITNAGNQWNHLIFTWNGNNINITANGVKKSALLQTGQTTVNRILFSHYDDEGEMWIDAVGFKTGDYQSTESFDYTTEEGVYYGTYDFRDDTIGQNPSGWTIANTGTCTTTVIESIGGHSKVLKCYDDDDTGQCVLYRYFTQGLDAVVEFWFRFEDNENGNLILYETNTQLAYFHINNNKLYWYNNSYIILKDPLNSNTWYHLKVELDDTANTGDVYLDGVQVGNNLVYRFNSVNGANRIYFVSETTATDIFTYYFNAFGISTDTTSHSGLGYKVGYNVNPYDLEPMILNNWYSNYLDYGETISVVNLDGHQNVLQLHTTTGYNYWIRSFGNTYSNSFVEFWWRGSSSAIYSEFRIQGNLIIYAFAAGGYFKYLDSSSVQHSTGVSIVADQWYHHKISFDLSAKTFDWYINGELKINDGEMYDIIGSYISNIRIHCSGNYYASLDALGLGWMGYTSGDNLKPYDPDYEIGMNIYPDNINMTKGSYDYTDNMKVLDASLTSFTSDYMSGTQYESPAQFGDFAFTKGSGGASGELETNNGNYARIDAEYTAGSETQLGTIYPEIDIITEWNYGDGTPHASKLDEGGGSPDGGNIREYNDGDSDKWDFTTLTLPANHKVTKMIVYVYIMEGSTSYPQYTVLTSSFSEVYGDIDSASTSYVWKTITKTGLSYDQADLNSFWINVMVSGSITYQDIEAVHVIVYTTPYTYSCDYTITWDVSGGYPIHTFYYDYRTTVAIDCDLDIYNWDTTGWLELESNTLSTYITDFYSLTDPYINDSNYVKIRFQTADSGSDFDMELDQITLGYYTIPAQLEFTILTPFDHYNSDLLSLHVESHQKTNISQQIYFKIWNYDTSTYDTISSATETTSITERDYNSVSPEDYINSDGVKLYWNGENTDNPFVFSIDYLLIRITYKMNLWHEVSFDTNGLWRYRWEIHGSLQYTDWTYFEVIDPVPNFHAISESDSTTRWILQNATLTAVENFTDDISGSNWDLYDVTSVNFDYIKYPFGDSYIIQYLPNNNYGTAEIVRTGYAPLIPSSMRTFLSFSGITSDYLFMNQTGSNQISLYCYTKDGTNNVVVYTTITFSEGTITWNNAPSPMVLQDTTSIISGINYWDIADLPNSTNYYLFKESTESGDFRYANYYSKESTSGYKPRFHRFDINKNYQGGGYTYMQTNTTELISLKSTVYGSNYTLSSGDYFEVDFQTSSDSQINLILLKDGVVNKTLTLSQNGNTNFNRHTVQISATEDLEFDQLKISSTFEDTDYVKVYDIKTKKYTLTGDYADFYIASHNQRDVYLTPDTYNLRIFEERLKKVDTNITISSDYYYVYTPTQTQQCRLTLFSEEGDYLNFEDYHVKINRSLNGEYNQFWLLDTIFYADDNTYVYIDVYDRFDSLIGSFERLASDYIDLEIEVYSLQIKNLQTQKTTIDINTTHVYPLLSEESIYFMLSKNYYMIGYYDTNNVYKQFLIYLDSNQAYELNRSKICFLAFVNQKGEHLYFDDYKTYINDTLIYENVFYREIGDDIGIEVKDIYGISIKNQTYTVISGDNYVPIILTMYSLKIMNQQLCFNHINITRDPNYYESEYYWSEWIAPSEIIRFRLFAGYYKINLTNNEDETYSYYAYTLSGDDILLIGSNNTIYNVLVNIANVNATIGNQITNVQIDLSNQNSQINNSIINVDINLGNINSTLGNMLVNLDVDITNIANNISTLYTFTNTSFINLGNDINVSFINIENNIISINQSISNLIVGVSNDIYLINGTISTMISELETNLLLMNVSIDTALFDIGTTLSQIGSNITSNYILLNNTLNLMDLNINDSRIAIINNLLLVNNTITTLISEVYSAVYMINNSIYTAVVDLGTYLSIMNNTINGNLSIVLEMNEFLTEIYKMTMFSDLLNWTDIGLNTSLLTSQVDAWEFINNYKNESIMVFLKYQDLIENLTISAQNTIEQYLPNEDVEYRLWSVEDEEYLNEWTPLPDNKTVSFGFFEEEVPVDPTPLATTYLTLFIGLIFFVAITLGVLKLYYKLKERKNPIPPEVLRYMNKQTKRKKQDGVVDNRI